MVAEQTAGNGMLSVGGWANYAEEAVSNERGKMYLPGYLVAVHLAEGAVVPQGHVHQGDLVELCSVSGLELLRHN